MPIGFTPSVRPITLKKEGDELLIIDWSDGRQTRHSWAKLRENCPCATCREDRAKPPDPFQMISPTLAAAGPLRPVAMTPIGRYAYKITWNDGHDTGIYSFDALRQLDEST